LEMVHLWMKRRIFPEICLKKALKIIQLPKSSYPLLLDNRFNRIQYRARNMSKIVRKRMLTKRYH